MPEAPSFTDSTRHNMNEEQRAVQEKAMRQIFNCYTYLKRMHHSELDPDEQREKAMVEARKAFFMLDRNACSAISDYGGMDFCPKCGRTATGRGYCVSCEVQWSKEPLAMPQNP